MKRLDCEQYSEEWYAARLGIPTVSQFGEFITPARGDFSKQHTNYIAELIVELVEGPSDNYESYYMQRGSILEAEARDWYAFRYDCQPEQCGLILNKGAGWSPDWLVGAKGAAEAKCPKPSTHVKWLLEDCLPNEHKPQLHGALHIGNLDWVDFVSYCPGFKTLVIRVEPNGYTDKVGEALDLFLTEYEAAKVKVLQ